MVTADPVNKPDEFAWQTFVEINQSANDGSPNLQWEAWATDQDLFGKPNITPDWNKRTTHELVLEPVLELKLFQTKANQNAPGAVQTQSLYFPEEIENDDLPKQEVRLNKSLFDYVVCNELWYWEGLEKVYTGSLVVDFPSPTREVKAIWQKLPDGQDASRYHSRVAKNKQVYVLTAMHIITKAVPNWTWATFEHVDNPGVPPSKDSFGFKQGGGKSDRPTPELKSLFEAANLGPEWLNYRLNATQVDFTDSTGVPVKLGNMQIEHNTTSSCMTCHARAAVVNDGSGPAVLDKDKLDPNRTGVPSWEWFWTDIDKTSAKARQLDFVWSFTAAWPRNGNPTPFSKWLSDNTKFIELQ
jgi:hypothetical protein